MKKLLAIAVLGLFLTSCVKGFDGIEPEPTPTPDPSPSSGVTEEDIQANFEKIFGVPYSTEQDWITTTKGSVSV